MYATEDETKLSKLFGKGQEQKIRRLIELSKEDIKNGTLNYREEDKNEYEFIRPFSIESYDIEKIVIFFKWIGLNIKKKSGGLLTKYIYHIDCLEFEKLNVEDKLQLKEEIVKVLSRVKSLEINSRENF